MHSPSSASKQSLVHSKPLSLPRIEDEDFSALIEELRSSQTQIEKSAINPLFNFSIPAEFPRAEQEEVTVSAQVLFSNFLESIMLANSTYQQPCPDSVESFVFAVNNGLLNSILPADQVVKYAKAGLSGVRLGADEVNQPSFLGQPLQVVTVRFFTKSKMSWNVGEGARGVQPLKLHAGTAVFPFLGDFHIENQQISEAQMNSLGFIGSGYRHQLEDGSIEAKLLEYPMFALGGRSLLAICNMSIPVRKTAVGGFAVAYDFFDPITEKSRSRNDIGGLPAIAIQWSGVGIRRYIYHAVRNDAEPHDDDTTLRVPELEKLSSEPVTIVQRRSYAGKSGIFLDLKHQPSGDAPTGGLSNAQVSFERDKLLLHHGAALSNITLAFAPILSREEIENLLGHKTSISAENLQISAKVVLDDTHRMDSILSMIESQGDQSAPHTIKAILKRDYADHSEQSVHRYLSKVAENLGKNARILLDLGFGLPDDQRFLDNISIYGGLADSENLYKLNNRYEIYHLVASIVKTFQRLSIAAGISEKNIWSSPAAKILLEEWFGERAGRTLRSELKSQFGDYKTASIWCSIAWILRSLSIDKKRLSTKKLGLILQAKEYAQIVDSKHIAAMKALGSGNLTAVGFLRPNWQHFPKSKINKISPDTFIDELYLKSFLALKLPQSFFSNISGKSPVSSLLESLEENGRINGETYR